MKRLGSTRLHQPATAWAPSIIFANERWSPPYVELYGENCEDVELTLKQALSQLWSSCFLACNMSGFTQVIGAIRNRTMHRTLFFFRGGATKGRAVSVLRRVSRGNPLEKGKYGSITRTTLRAANLSLLFRILGGVCLTLKSPSHMFVSVEVICRTTMPCLLQHSPALHMGALYPYSLFP